MQGASLTSPLPADQGQQGTGALSSCDTQQCWLPKHRIPGADTFPSSPAAKEHLGGGSWTWQSPVSAAAEWFVLEVLLVWVRSRKAHLSWSSHFLSLDLRCCLKTKWAISRSFRAEGECLCCSPVGWLLEVWPFPRCSRDRGAQGTEMPRGGGAGAFPRRVWSSWVPVPASLCHLQWELGAGLGWLCCPLCKWGSARDALCPCTAVPAALITGTILYFY